MSNEQKLREALQEVIAYARESGHDWLCLTEAEQALATTEPAVNQQLTTEPVDEQEAFEKWLGIKPCGAAHDFGWAAWRARAAMAQGVKG